MHALPEQVQIKVEGGVAVETTPVAEGVAFGQPLADRAGDRVQRRRRPTPGQRPMRGLWILLTPA